MGKPLKKAEDSLYETDFFAWTQEQAAKLRARAHNDIDWENAAEEIESLGRSDKREIESRLKVLLVHLLKWHLQPEKRKWGWSSTIIEQRRRLRRLLEDSPSLRSYPQEAIDSEYALARYDAAGETELPFEAFPESCPYAIDDILDFDFYPGGEKPA